MERVAMMEHWVVIWHITSTTCYATDISINNEWNMCYVLETATNNGIMNCKDWIVSKLYLQTHMNSNTREGNNATIKLFVQLLYSNIVTW